MANDQQVPWYQQGILNWQPQSINPKPLGGYGFGFQGLGSVPQSDILSQGFGLSSEEAMQGSSLTPAKNSAQMAEGGAGSLVRAMELIGAMSGGKEKALDQGIPLPGSESTKLKYSASGVPFYTTSVSARDDSGKFKERTEFDLSGQPIKTRGDIMEGMNKLIEKEKPSWEKPRVNPYLGTSF